MMSFLLAVDGNYFKKFEMAGRDVWVAKGKIIDYLRRNPDDERLSRADFVLNEYQSTYDLYVYVGVNTKANCVLFDYFYSKSAFKEFFDTISGVIIERFRQ